MHLAGHERKCRHIRGKTYILIDSFKKVYFIVMFDVVSSPKTTVEEQRYIKKKGGSCIFVVDFCIRISVHGCSFKMLTAWQTHSPETKLCLVKIDFYIPAVCDTKLNENIIPPVVPLGCCWMPVNREELLYL